MMNRRLIHRLLTGLLALLPTVLPAQQLSSWEYWFDDDEDHKTGYVISGTESNIATDIPTDGLAPGIHQLHVRVVQKGGEYGYSPIYTTTFFKRSTGSGRQMEYWYDDDYDNSKICSMNADGEVEKLDFDMTSLSPGLHRLNMRVASTGQGFGTIYSANVLKTGSGNVDKLEYWADNDFENRKSISVYKGNDVMAHFIGDLDLSQLPTGVCHLNYRVLSSTGNAVSAIGSIPVMVGKGATALIEYWIDDDYGHRRTMEGKVVTSGYHFSQDVDLSGVTPGVHRLNYRIVYPDGNAKAAISSTPFMANSCYDGDGSDAVVTSVGFAFDKDQTMLFEVPGNRSTVDYNLTLDARKLSKGDHSLKVVAWNSLGTSSSVSSPFSVQPETKPEITLTAENINGKVKLSFTPAPNDMKNGVQRTDANGAKVGFLVPGDGCYPAPAVYYDEPGTGTYSYVAMSKYTDANGKTQTVYSQPVEVTWTQPEPADVVKTVDLTGYIEMDAYTPLTGLTVKLSDDYVAAVRSNGMFLIKAVPVGAVFTPQVIGDANHDYTLATITVGTRNDPLVLKGSLKDDVLEQNNLTNHLALASALSWTTPARSVTFKVKNLSNKAWTGYVRAKAVPYSPFNSEDKLERMSSGKNLELLPAEEDITTIQIAGYTTQEITILTEGLSRNKDKSWQFYLESVGCWGNDAVEVRPLSMDDVFYDKNLFYRNIEANLTATGANRVLDADEARKMANMTARLSSVVEGLDGQVGDMSYYRDEVVDAARSMTGITDEGREAEAVQKMMEQLKTMDVSDILKVSALQNFFSSLNAINSYTVSTAVSVMHDKYCSNITGILKVAEDVGNAVSFLSTAYELSQQKKLHDKYFVMADWMANLATDYNLAYGTLLKGYVVLSKEIIKQILKSQGVLFKSQQVLNLQNNRFVPPAYDEPQPKYLRFNNCMDFRFRVKKLRKGYFTPREVKEQVDYVRIVAKSQLSGAEETFECDLETIADDETDEMRLKNKDYVMVKQTTNGTNTLNGGDIVDLFLEIHWANGVIVKVPLLEKDEGDIEFDAGHGTGDITGLNLNYKPAVYTVTFRTQTTEADQMANSLEMK